VRTPRDRRDVWPEFLELWEELCQASLTYGTTVVVEGERDRASLRRLGLPGPVVLLHHGRTLSEVAHELGRARQRVIVLTDWDVEGGHLAQKLRELLLPGPAEVDLDFRRRIAQLLHGDLAHVEGLAGWARRTAEGIGAPLEHFVRSGAPD
jgi:5S rRNA maturation endonuclease (ribonuclease M5)